MSHVLRVGVADQIAYFRAYNTDGSAKTDLTSSTTGLSLSVFRVGVSSVSIASLSNKAADDTAHADGAIRNVGGNLYTIDIPDAATATQVPSIVVRGSYTGGVVEGLEHPIVAYDPSVNYGTNAQSLDIQSSVSNIETKVDTLLARITSTLFSGITYLSRWLGAIAGKTADTSTRAEINATTAGTSYNETTDSLEAVRDRGDAAWITGSSSDSGARTITITVNDGTNPLQGAKVRVRQGAENYVKETNASGVVEFNLDDFTWNVAITKPQYEFMATTLVVNGSTSPPTYSMTLVSLTPSDADKVTGYWTVLDEEGDPAVGVVVKVNAVLQPTGAEGIIHVKTTRTATTDSNGVADFANMLPGWTYSVSLDGQTVAQVTIDSAATGTVELGSCVLAE